MKSTIIRVASSVVAVALLSEALWALFRISGITLFADSRYWCTWSPISQGLTSGAVSPEFIYWSLGINIVTSLIFILIYRKVRKFITGGVVSKGIKFSALAFLTGSLPVLLMGGMMVYFSPSLIVLGIIASFVVMMINGIVVAAINRQ